MSEWLCEGMEMRFESTRECQHLLIKVDIMCNQAGTHQWMLYFPIKPVSEKMHKSLKTNKLNSEHFITQIYISLPRQK